MLAIQTYIDQIGHKTQLLIQKMKFLKRENAEMMEEIIELKQQIEKYKLNIANLEAQLNKARGVMADRSPEKRDDNEKIRAEIDLYIKEIDKCLEWLQSV
jgi:septal ring factor EnvC (AmiA/AmiB activator)